MAEIKPTSPLLLAEEVLEQLPDKVIAFDTEQRVLFLNAAAAQHYDVTREEALGRPLSELYSWRWLRPHDEAEAEVALNQRGVWQGETLHIARDGRQTFMESTVTLLRDAAGQQRGLVAVTRDVDGRKRLERNAAYLTHLSALITQVREARLLLPNVLGQLAEHLAVNHVTYLDLGGPSALTTDQDLNTFDPLRFDELLPRDAWESVRRGLSLVVDDLTVDSRTVEHRERFRALGLRGLALVTLPDLDGPAALLCATTTQPRAWKLDELEAIRETLGRVQPMLERSRAVEALRRSEMRFRQVFENAPTGIGISDVVGRFQQCNAAFEALVGYSEAELSGRPFDFLIHPDDRVANLAQFMRMRAGELPFFEIENRYVHRDGHEVWVHKFAMALRDDAGATTNFVVLVTDMTQRRKAEEALRQVRDELEARVQARTAELQQRANQLSRLASDLTLADQRARKQLAQVLHDHLQQLLASAKMNVEVLAKGPSNPEAALDRIRKCLDEALASSRSLSVELSPPLLHEFGLAAGLEWLAEWMHEKHGLTVRLELDPEANPVSEDVRTLVFESVRELLFNTVKHAGVREALVGLAIEDSTQCRVTVKDEGQGYDPDVLLSESSLTHLGTGLFNVRERLMLLGGSMRVETDPGRGTSIALIAPRKATHAP